MKDAIIIRYCEIHLKGKNRGFFENLLTEAIKRGLKDIEHTFYRVNARYVVTNFNQYDYDLIVDKLKKIPGIHTFSLAKIVKNDIDQIREACLLISKGKKGLFKVETNRADKTFPLNSIELSREIGGDILESNSELTVNVINPQIIVNIDIRESGETYIYTDSMRGLGGLPSGSSGKGLLLLSGGIDSPVAGFMMAKRGMTLDGLHFHSYPYTSEAALDKVKTLASMVAEYSNGLNLHIVKFTHIQEEIHEKCPEELMITMMRRFMMRIAEKVSIMNKCQAIITGENLGQVASQTVESITSSNSVVKMPVFRPLIAFDKLDIIEIAQKINTFETSIMPYEDCCTVFLPKFPAIKPKMETILKAESVLDVDKLVDEAISEMYTVCFNHDGTIKE